MLLSSTERIYRHVRAATIKRHVRAATITARCPEGGAIGLGTVGSDAFFPSIAAAAPGEAATAVLPANPTSHYLLEMSGIPGDSTDVTYRHQIVVDGWSWGLTNPGTIAAGSGRGSGKWKPLDFVSIAPWGVASPLTALAAATGGTWTARC
ncbi:hypothetical protein ABIB25_003511 [Nakamurella sp. UYEF19]|uniref:type VI secretion system tube protein Hcp n=1 Tax=Nakamurella sp. UYEF19 TaxID=1756392 RepID=UPI003395617C